MTVPVPAGTDAEREEFRALAMRIEVGFAANTVEPAEQVLAELLTAPRGLYVSIGSLRSSFRARRMLPSWPLLRDQVRERLIAAGHDEKRTLRGLLDD